MPVVYIVVSTFLSNAAFTVPPVTMPVSLSAILPSFATFTVKVLIWLVPSVEGVTVAPSSPFTSTKPVMTFLPASVILLNAVSALPAIPVV